MENKPITLPPETQKAIAAFFMRTSAPRILAREKMKQEKEALQK